VEIQLPAEGEGNKISVGNVSEEYLQMARHPAYKNSTLVQKSAMASRLIVTGSSYIGNALTSGAESFTKKTKPNPKPMTFSETTHARFRKIGTLSHGAADLSAKTVGQVGKVAQNFGASLTRREGKQKGVDKYGNGSDYKPGILNKSLIAFSTLADGIEQGARNMLTSGSVAASTMIAHRYGAEAGAVASNVTGGIKNVGLVYIDASGVSRKAVLKSVAKGMVVGRMRDGKQVVVGTGDGGEVPPSVGGPSQSMLGGRDPVARRPSPSPTPPPAYGASGTVSLGGTAMSGGKR
jgi:spartin